jgi:ribonuclease HI
VLFTTEACLLLQPIADNILRDWLLITTTESLTELILRSPLKHAHTSHLAEAHISAHDHPLPGPSFSRSTTITHVGIDGSYKEDGPPGAAKAAAGVAYLVRMQDGRQAIHITNSTFTGKQSSEEAEMASAVLGLRLAPLLGQQHLNIGWDCLNPLRHLWHKHSPSIPSANGPHKASAAPQPNATLAGHPQMRRILELLAAAGRQHHSREFHHQAAHKADAVLCDFIKPNKHTPSHTYVLPDRLCRDLLNKARDVLLQQTPPTPNTEAEAISLALNACADWAAKQVTVHSQPALHHLGPSKWPPSKYCVANLSGEYENSSPAAVRNRVITDASTLALHS